MKQLQEKGPATNTPGQVAALVDQLRAKSDHEIVKAAMVSKGDLAKVPGYDNLSKCIVRLGAVDAGSGSLGKGLRSAREAESMLLRNKPVFEKAFAKNGSEAVRLAYAGAVAALWHTVTLLCAEGVILVKGGDGRYSMTANKLGASAVAEGLPATRLAKFVELGNRHGFQQAMTETAAAVESEMLGENWGLVAVAIAGGVALLIGLLGLAREMAEYYYRLRGTFSRWLDLQASFLEMNAAALGEDKGASREKQEQYAKRLRALADRVRVDDADAEKNAKKELATVPVVSTTPAAPAVAFSSGTGGIV